MEKYIRFRTLKYISIPSPPREILVTKKKIVALFFDASTLLDKITRSINNLCLIRSESDAMSEVV